MSEFEPERDEARVFSRQVLRLQLDDACVERYVQAVRLRAKPVNARDERVLRFARRHPRAVPLLDGALALLRPEFALHQRLLALSAIAEATPQGAELFLPVDRSRAYYAVLLATVVRCAFRFVAGTILLLCIR